jgi:succinylglutamate desuccinylase
MRVEKLGEGEPEYAVVGAVHGDEPCGKAAIERFIESGIEVKRPVKLVVANEKALERGERYTEADLNRSFPGNGSSSVYEERLAASIMDELEGLTVLDLHSTKSYSGVFAANSKLSNEEIEIIKDSGAEIASFHAETEIGCIDEHLKCVSVECGHQGSVEAEENAYRIMKNFLAANQVIDAEFTRSDPTMFQVYETVEKPDYEFLAENFKLVEPGEVYAVKGGRELKAEEPFYPVLMSTNGYSDILGHKAKMVEEV